MNLFQLLIDHAVAIVGFLLALFLMVKIMRERRAPATTMAWLLAIVLIPYVGVPAFVLFGGRKIKRLMREKHSIKNAAPVLARPNAPMSMSSIFAQRSGPHPVLLLCGESAFACLLDTIKGAQRSIRISTFIFGTDAIGEAILRELIVCLHRGVDVCLLVDALGSFKLTKLFLAKFKAAGGKYAYFMPMIHLPFRGRANLRNHRKLIIVDESSALLGGMNLTQQYMGPHHDATRWNDIAISVQGAVVKDLSRVFASDWHFAAGYDLELEDDHPFDAIRSEEEVRYQAVPSGPDITSDALYDALLTLIFTARKRIWIVTPYFIPDEMMLKALCVASTRQVDVRIIVPHKSNHTIADLVRRGYLRIAQQAGARLYFYQPGMLHTKLILIDDQPAILGSMNMDMRSFFLNYEIALFIYSAPALENLTIYAEGLMRKSRTGLAKTPMPVEFLESVLRLFAPLL